jgi:predicted molibdopterin-dependent oxidoreductase YjgC
VQPGIFFEIPEELAKEKGIKNGDTVRVSSARASITGPAMVTRRMPHFDLDGKRVWQIGFPIHWGFSGDAKHAGPLANLMTSWAIDPNTWTPSTRRSRSSWRRTPGRRATGRPGRTGEEARGEGLTMPIPGLEVIQSSASLRVPAPGSESCPG